MKMQSWFKKRQVTLTYFFKFVPERVIFVGYLKLKSYVYNKYWEIFLQNQNGLLVALFNCRFYLLRCQYKLDHKRKKNKWQRDNEIQAKAWFGCTND